MSTKREMATWIPLISERKWGISSSCSECCSLLIRIYMCSYVFFFVRAAAVTVEWRWQMMRSCNCSVLECGSHLKRYGFVPKMQSRYDLFICKGFAIECRFGVRLYAKFQVLPLKKPSKTYHHRIVFRPEYPLISGSFSCWWYICNIIGWWKGKFLVEIKPIKII